MIRTVSAAFGRLFFVRLFSVALFAIFIAECTFPSSEASESDELKPRQAMFVGLDVSGSFKRDYDDAVAFLAHYLYGHLKGLGGLEKPRDLFVAAIGGKGEDDPKTFHPIHDFNGKDLAQIEASLREWFPTKDTYSDFNAFFHKVARIAKERNLLLAPITVFVVSDGVPDVPGATPGTRELYRHIDLSPIEYLSKNVTLRLTYASPKVGEYWRNFVAHDRVRLWTVEAEVMKGWRGQLEGGVDLRSEEHTSELQSRLHLVCRLLLEKKKGRMFEWRGDLQCSSAWGASAAGR